MPITLQCQACGESFSVDESLKGQMVKCSKCKSEVKALGPTGEVDESLSLDLDEPGGPPDPGPGPVAAPSFDNVALEEVSLDLPPDDDGGVALTDPGQPAMPAMGDVGLADPGDEPVAHAAPAPSGPPPGMGATMTAPDADEMSIQDEAPSGVPGGPPPSGLPPEMASGSGGEPTDRPQAVRMNRDKRGLPIPVLAGVGVAVLVALYFLAGMFTGGGSAETGALEMAARVPKDSAFVMALPKPRKTVAEYTKYARDTMKDGDAKATYNDMRMQAKELLGFDPTIADQYADGGIDLAKPATFSVLPLAGGNIPKGLLITTGAVNFGKVIGTMRTAAKHLDVELDKDSKGDPDVYSIKSTVAATVVDDRMLLYVAPPGGDPVKSLRQHLAEGGKGQLAQDEDFKATLAGLTEDGEIQGFVNTRALGRKLKNGSALKSIQGIAFSGSGDKSQLFMRLPENDKLLKMLEPGQECRDFLKKVPKPMLAITCSSKDLYALLDYLIKKSGQKDGMKSVDQAVKAAGQSASDLKKIMKDCALGVCLYKAEGGMIPLSILVFVKTADAKGELEGIKKDMPGGESVKKGANEIIIGQNPLSGPIALGVVDSFLICSTDPELAKDIVNVDAKGWRDPKVGGKDLFAMEVFSSEMAEAIASMAPEGQKKMFGDLGGSKSDVFLAVSGVETGISIRTESGGDPTAMLASLGVPAVMVAAAMPEVTGMLPVPGGPAVSAPGGTGPVAGGDPKTPADTQPAPPAKPKKLTPEEMKANEDVAVENIRLLIEAQKKYFENDWDGDGVKEYAQTFKELKEPGGQPGTLLPETMEGTFGDDESVIAGYAFRVLTSQGAYAPGGKKDYMKKENMVGGFALIAYPTAYEGTGKNTYIADIKGKIAMRDMGKRTTVLGGRTSEYSPTRVFKPVK